MTPELQATAADRLLNVREAAEYLGLSVGTVYHQCSERRLPCIRLSNRCLRFRKSMLDEYIRGHSTVEP